jgi:CRP/FNR family cyclic AMP-dependent transcriptional regulator
MSFLKFFTRSRAKKNVVVPQRDDDSGYYATQFVDRNEDTRLFTEWSLRGADLQARPYDSSLGVLSLVKLLGQDRALANLGAEQLSILGGYFDYVQLDNGKQLIGQDEQGDFLLVVLQGVVAEDRKQPSGRKARIGESRAGDLLGEMSMLDGGTRFCSCTSLTPVAVAVLSSQSLQRMMQEEPYLAASLMAWMAKRLSLRLRQVSARLSVILTRQDAD